MRAALLLLAIALPPGARAAPELLIEAEISPARVYVGEEARLVLRVLRAPGVPPGTLRPPPLGGAGELSLLGVRIYDAERAGVRYRVFERSNLLVPRQAGRLTVPGAQFESSQYLTELFGREAGRPRVVRGPERVLQVRPAPAGAAEPFLPARSLSLAESWSRDLDALATGVPVTRTLVLEAVGLAAERLPRLEMAASPRLHVHHDRPELATEYREAGMLARRVQRIVLMPIAEGSIALPELRVAWWDVQADAARAARIPGRTLLLQPAIAPVARPPEAPPAVGAADALRALAGALLAATLVVFWWYVRTQAQRDARGRLRAACRRNDARRARDALLEWRRAARADGIWSAAGREALAALDAALYGRRAWDGKDFWRAVRPCLRKAGARRAAPKAPLPPLYRLQARYFDAKQ